MKQPLGAQRSAQEEPGLQIWNPQALQNLAAQTSKAQRIRVWHKLWEARQRFT